MSEAESNLPKATLKRVILTLFFCLLGVSYGLCASPTVDTVSPASGVTEPNLAQTFISTYSDRDGWADLKDIYFLISSSTSDYTQAVYLYYNRSTNLLYLRNDDNTAWIGGGYSPPGAPMLLQNSRAILDCKATTVSGMNQALTVNWRLTFKPGFSGRKYNLYLLAKDFSHAKSGWEQRGTCTVNSRPQTGNVTPFFGSSIANTQQFFTTTFLDPDGWQNIRYGYLHINRSRLKKNCFYAYYDAETNLLYLRSDNNWSWLGGFPPGSSNVIENSYASLDCASTTVTGQGTTLSITWPVTFKSTFCGIKRIFLAVTDYVGARTGWFRKGRCRVVKDTTPPAITITPPATPTNQPVILSYTVSDNATPSGQISVTGDNSPYTEEGGYNVTLTAEDASGNSSTAEVSFTIDKTPPAIVITSPQDGAVVEEPVIQLQGSVDNIPFSQEYQLVEGENTLTKEYADSAGNSASASVKVNLYLGTSIGPEGGEVSSPDGRAKLSVPQGALSENTTIRLLTLDKTSLYALAPEGKSLLCVVECKPLGLNFTIPARLTYLLEQAEIPGTVVSLGLYENGQIYLTAEPSVVPVDGYQASFNIQHFSTYTALASLTPQNTPIGAGVKIPLPDLLTGSFSSAIPLSVSPGRKGMQPQLSLNYRSSNPNSWLGVGFSLNPGCITRSTRLGPPSYNDTQDTFYLVTDAGTTELVHLLDNLYQAKVESSFTKFFKDPGDCWRALSKDGSQLFFGQSPDSKESSSKGTFSWHLTKAEDTNGNYIQYSYAKDEGKCYLSRIDYTGNNNGLAPTNNVEFFLEPRTDVPSSYISGSRIATARRLKEIQVKQDSLLVWRYELEYAYSPDTNRSLLKSVTQFAADGKSLPVQRLSYQGSGDR